MIKIIKTKIQFHVLGRAAEIVHLNIEDETGVWEETGSNSQMDIFIEGIRCGRHMSKKYDVAMEYKEFNSDIYIREPKDE